MMTTNPITIFGIKNKGIIKKGYDADIIIIDMNKEDVIKGKNLYTKVKWSPFEGFKTKGKTFMTMINGNIVFDNEKIDSDYKGKEVEFR